MLEIELPTLVLFDLNLYPARYTLLEIVPPCYKHIYNTHIDPYILTKLYSASDYKTFINAIIYFIATSVHFVPEFPREYPY